jgi:predicted N-acetyltransferase YhbS
MKTKALPRWGESIIGDAEPSAVLTLALDGEVISRVEMFQRQVNWGGDRLRLLGIGGVWTAPAHRRLGHARVLVEQAHALAGKWGYDGTILFSLKGLIPYYQGLDYAVHQGTTTIRQPEVRVIPLPEEVFVLTRPVGHLPEVQSVEIEGLPW